MPEFLKHKTNKTYTKNTSAGYTGGWMTPEKPRRLQPYEIVEPYISIYASGSGEKAFSRTDRDIADMTWNAQENLTNGENVLVVVDSSGSMYWRCGYNDAPLPAALAHSLAIYFGERNRGIFHNCFMTFSTNPKLVEIKGRDILEKLKYCMSLNECANIDMKKVFRLILLTAIRNNMPKEELPSTIYIVSDMDFDWCTQNSQLEDFEYAKKRFEAHGYKLPRVVFWNAARQEQKQPVTRNEQGVVLVSGCTSGVFESVVRN